MIVKGKGDNLGGLPPTPLALPMRVQLQATNGQCWEASFFASGVVRNETGFFKGKAGSPSGAFLDR